MNFLFLPVPFVAMVLVLRLMGRPWWCECGSWKIYATGHRHYSQHLVDPWTFTHYGHGIFFFGTFHGFMPGYGWATAALLSLSAEAVWEVLENTPWVVKAYRRCGDRFYYGDSVANSLGDLAACLCGILSTSVFV